MNIRKPRPKKTYRSVRLIHGLVWPGVIVDYSEVEDRLVGNQQRDAG